MVNKQMNKINKYLLSIGFDDAHLPLIFNTDDRSNYSVPEIIESYVDQDIESHLKFAEWLDINGVRNDRHEWKYKGDNYTKKYTTKEMFDKWKESQWI